VLNKQIELFEGVSAQLVSPRVNVMVTTINKKGQVNSAPFSFICPVSYVPPRFGFSCMNFKHHRDLGFHYADTKPVEQMLKLKQYANESEKTIKDTLANVLEVPEFGMSILSIEYVREVALSASRFPLGVNEMEVTGLTSYPSTKIKPPLIKEAKVGLECKKIAHYEVGKGQHAFTFVIGEAIALHIDSEIMDGGEIKPERMRSLLQVAGPTYGVCTEFKYELRHPYPDDIPMPKPSR